MTAKKIGVLVGSLRKESFCRKVAKALQELTPAGFSLELIEIGDLAMYNQDLDDEGHPPAAWTAFRECARNYDAFLFVTPEYNRSVPAVLKNALDIGSRPFGKNVLDGKPGAVMSVSPGGISGFGANHHLRQSLVCLNVPTMQQPEAYVGNAAVLFDTNGDLISDNTRAFFQKFMTAFTIWIMTNTGNNR
ncbi:NADPH-dependent FMN reductase [Sporomusa termitida]|uniref:Quinone reductase n=1 Tax=Sporomusa termitida TaxID=2377 RepID=A0A517DQB6_9FIRM|nr:NAD(P)H-dependent oxidoreductase [Sporomusa termitida]QDR79466.1 Quinone reductase [Sporomusa termitida]